MKWYWWSCKLQQIRVTTRSCYAHQRKSGGNPTSTLNRIHKIFFIISFICRNFYTINWNTQGISCSRGNCARWRLRTPAHRVRKGKVAAPGHSTNSRSGYHSRSSSTSRWNASSKSSFKRCHFSFPVSRYRPTLWAFQALLPRKIPLNSSNML